MPARKDANPVFGVIPCPDCGASASVKQTRRGKGRFLYSCCPNCGTDQRNGVEVQSRLFFKTVWRDGVEVIKPPCIKHIENYPIGSNEPEEQPNEVSKQAALVEKEEAPVIEPETKKEQPNAQPSDNRKSGLFIGLLLALSLGVGAVVVK